MDQYSREFIAEKARLRPEDLGLADDVRTARRSHNQLGLAYQIAFIRLTGRAPGQQPFEILEDRRVGHGLCGNGAECESPRSRSLCAAPANALGPSGEGPRAPWPHSLQPAGASHADPTRAPQGRTATRPRPVRPLRPTGPTGSARLRTPNALGPSGEGPRAPWPHSLQPAGGAASCLLLILAAIIYYWQIREIDRVLSEAGSDADDLNFELLSHISPIGWDNVLLYGEYQLNRSLVRSERLSV